jgi:Phosphatidylinositolglycan class N (PIG-N)
MLVAGELALRRVSEIEATTSGGATRTNFKRTSRTQARVIGSFPAVLIYLQVYTCQLLLTVLSMVNTVASVRSLQAKQGLPLLNQAVGWIVFGAFKVVSAPHARFCRM